MMRLKVKEVIAAFAVVLIGAVAAWAIVASPGEVVPLRLSITSGGIGVTGLKPTARVVRQDGTVFLNTTLMVPADGIPGAYGSVFVCPAGQSHFTAYLNNTGMYADSETTPIDSTNMSGGGAGGTTVTLLPFQGSVSYAGPVATKSPARIIQGDTPTLPATIKQSGGAAFDLTGWTVKWAVKKNITDTTYVVSLRDVTVDVEAPATGGVVDIKFLAADTATLSPGLYYGEIKLYKGGQVFTPWQCSLYVDPALIK